MGAETAVLSIFGMIIGLGVVALVIYFCVRAAVTDGMKRYWQWRVEDDAKRNAGRARAS